MERGREGEESKQAPANFRKSQDGDSLQKNEKDEKQEW